MECDLVRLQIAIEAASERLTQDRRFQIGLAGGEVEDEPEGIDEDQDDETFNARVSGWLSSWKGS